MFKDALQYTNFAGDIGLLLVFLETCDDDILQCCKIIDLSDDNAGDKDENGNYAPPDWGWTLCFFKANDDDEDLQVLVTEQYYLLDYNGAAYCGPRLYETITLLYTFFDVL